MRRTCILLFVFVALWKRRSGSAAGGGREVRHLGLG